MSIVLIVRRFVCAAAFRRPMRALHRPSPAAALASLCLLVTSISASAIIKRHDVSDFKYRELGETYRHTIVEGIVPGSNGSPMLGNGNGTLVAPEWILTAAHVAAALPQTRPSDGSRPANVSINGIWYPIEAVYLHPDWSGVESPQDIALIRLSEPVPGARPACLYPARDEVGRTAVVVGTGGTGDGVTGSRRLDGKLRGATIRIGSLEKSGMQLGWRFRGPTESGVTPLEGISGPGDSGGPAFLRHRGRLCVAGVSSGQEGGGLRNGQYGVTEFYSRVSFFRSWIERVMAEGGSAARP
ncbi:MAG TPA: trypsin-like serine protease [Allosphingosinicella sp.]|jgi:hypothetical protein